MADNDKTDIGKIEWRDLTVNNAVQIKDFYSNVVGWQTEAVSMGDYDDFNVNLPNSDESGRGECIAGICHARGGNANIPPQWLMYVRVKSVQESAEQTVLLGGKVIDGPKAMGKEQICIIEDPAGAVLALVST